MTRKLFWANPYQTELDTVIAQVQDNEVTVESTIFYAFSGAQESDTGTIGENPVLQARKEGSDIVYTLPTGHGLQTGQAVRMVIDWPRRYRLMRLHFAAEIVLALTYRLAPGIEKIGAHIAEDKARIDFQWSENISALFSALQEQSSRLIEADLPIISAFSDESVGRRYWEIVDFARVPCGGTHLRSTGEVGVLALKRKNIGKGKERIEIFLQD